METRVNPYHMYHYGLVPTGAFAAQVRLHPVLRRTFKKSAPSVYQPECGVSYQPSGVVSPTNQSVVSPTNQSVVSPTNHAPATHDKREYTT